MIIVRYMEGDKIPASAQNPDERFGRFCAQIMQIWRGGLKLKRSAQMLRPRG